MARIVIAIGGAVALAGCSQADDAAPADPATSEAAADAEAPSPAPGAAEEDIDRFLLQEYPEAGSIRYALAWNDLDGDGTDEAIVYPVGPYFCGSGGCNLLILTQAGTTWSKVGDISVSRTPVSELESASNGWKDLAVAVSGGGGPSGRVVLSFDGEGYPGNASTAPAAPADAEGIEILAEEPEMREAVAVQEAGPGSAE